MDQQRSLVVKVTCGAEAPERVNQAFTVAATAASAGVATTMFLTGDAAWLAVPGRADEVDLPLATPLPELLTTVLELGALSVCTQCAGRRGLTEADLVDGIDIRGAAAFVELALAPGAQALVY